MLLSALSFLVVAQSSSEVPEGLMNNPVYIETRFGKYSSIVDVDTGAVVRGTALQTGKSWV